MKGTAHHVGHYLSILMKWWQKVTSQNYYLLGQKYKNKNYLEFLSNTYTTAVKKCVLSCTFEGVFSVKLNRNKALYLLSVWHKYIK